MKRNASGKIGSIVLLALLISVAALSVFTIYPYDDPQSQVQTTTYDAVSNVFVLANLGNHLLTGMNVSLRLTVLNTDGSVVTTRNYPSDIITNQMIDFIGDFFGNNQCANNIKDTAGTVTNACLWCSGSLGSPFGELYNAICNGNSSYPSACCGGSIGVGTGTNPVARTDYNLQTQVGSAVAVNTPTIAGNSIVFVAGITLTSAATVTEAAFFATTGDTVSYMIFHDEFTGISISADQTIQVQYTLNFPTGTNQNFLAFVASWLEPVALSRDNIGTLVNSADTIHNSGTLLFWSTSQPSGCNGFCASTPIIEVGTSSTAPTASDYILNAQVGPTNAVVTTTIDTTTNYRVLMQNSITLTSSYTIQEAGYFCGTTDGNYLMFHLLTGAVSIPANNGITTQFTIGF